MITRRVDDYKLRDSSLLLALLVGSGSILQPAGVLHPDPLANLGLGPGSLGDSGLGNTHGF